MKKLRVKRNVLTAPEFIRLWKTVWENPPTIAQAQMGIENSVYTLAVYDEEKIVAMCRMIGDMGMCFYMKDIVVRPEYQNKGIEKMMVNDMLRFIKNNSIEGTSVYAEISAAPEAVSLYEELGFDSDEDYRMKKMCTI